MCLLQKIERIALNDTLVALARTKAALSYATIANALGAFVLNSLEHPSLLCNLVEDFSIPDYHGTSKIITSSYELRGARRKDDTCSNLLRHSAATQKYECQ